MNSNCSALQYGILIFTFTFQNLILTVHSFVYDIGVPGWAVKLKANRLFFI